MTIELFNIWWFVYIFIAIGIFTGLFFLLRKKSEKVKKYVIGGLLIFNLALHFIKLSFHPYTTFPDIAASQIWFVNICAVSILVFPFIFFGKNKYLKDFMFYLGVLSGFLAIIMPFDTMGNKFYALDTIRFYLAHMLIIIAPLLMVTLKLHTVSYKRIWAMPLWIAVYLLFIMVQNVLQSEMGIIYFRSNDFFNPNFHNPSFVWGPNDEDGQLSELSKLFSVFTPNFMKIVPFGPYKGEPKFWPFFWLLPGAFIYFWGFPLVFNLVIPESRRELFNDVKTLVTKAKVLFKPKTKEIATSEASADVTEINDDTN